MSHPDVEHATLVPASPSGNNHKSQGHEAYKPDASRVKDGLVLRKCINDDKRVKDEMAEYYSE
jgi:hypothetical protein